MNVQFLFYDTETTGSKEDDRILEIAYCLYKFDDSKELPTLTRFTDFKVEMINPQHPINPVASATHGYRQKDVDDKPTWSHSEANKNFQKVLANPNVYFLAHNAPFDREMLKKEGINIPLERSIDTLRLAKHLLADRADIESFGLQPLRYLLNLDDHPDCIKIQEDFNVLRLQPHTALSDIIALIWLIQFLIVDGKIKSFTDILSNAHKPIFVDKVDFGKVFEKGSPLSAALSGGYTDNYGRYKTGLGYFNWVLSSADLGPESKANIAYHAMKLVQEGQINADNEDLEPFISYAATFLPEFSDFIVQTFGKEPSVLRADRLDKINKDLVLALESDKSSIQNSAREKLRELDFLNTYYNTYSMLQGDTPPWEGGTVAKDAVVAPDTADEPKDAQ